MRLTIVALLLQASVVLGLLTPRDLRAFVNVRTHTSSREQMMQLGAFHPVLSLRGGMIQSNIRDLPKALFANPNNLFNGIFVGLFGTVALWKVLCALRTKQNSLTSSDKPPGVSELQVKFLSVFWLMRMADWLQGPYFYEVYASKILNGQPVSLDMVSKLFLVGFASTGVFGPWIGRFVDTCGRKAGTILFAILYSLGALSTRSNALALLLLGRVAGGIGTSLLFSAPEAWLLGEHQKNNYDGKWLGETFSLAYAGDSLVAIAAGQLASLMASREGPTGPFTLSLGFLVVGSLLAAFRWTENVAAKAVGVKSESKKPNIMDAVDVVLKDKRIIMVGAMQALFEGAMYIFVLQWPPAVRQAILNRWPGYNIPYGKIFSCFMASCLLGSTAFGALQKKGVTTEKTALGMMIAATSAMGLATAAVGSNALAVLLVHAAFFIFEICVGMYFPSIGTLRSKYIPDSHRSVIMNLFGIPLNLIVVGVFLSIKALGVQGALASSTLSLTLATIGVTVLNFWKRSF